MPSILIGILTRRLKVFSILMSIFTIGYRGRITCWGTILKVGTIMIVTVIAMITVVTVMAVICIVVGMVIIVIIVVKVRLVGSGRRTAK